MTAVGDEEAKLVYIKRWRTIVKLPRKYADEIVSALRSSASAAAPKVRTSHHLNKEETARLQGGKDAMDDQRDPDATRAFRMEQFDEDRPSPASSEAMLAKVSPLKFKTAEDRDAFAKRLNGHAYYMIRSRDQGHDGRIGVTDELIDDLRAAAAIVACSEVCTKSPTS